MPDVLDSQTLQLGVPFTTTFSLLLAIPEDEVAPSDPEGTYGDDVWKPRSFDEWIRGHLQADALQRAINSQFAADGRTTRVEVDRCEVLSTRPAMSETPELRGKGVGVQRAEVRVTITPVHNALFTVIGIIGIVSIAFASIAVAASVVWVLREIRESGPRIVGDLGPAAAKLGLGLAALGLGLAFLLSKAK